MKKSAFTLIELLVVISIIAILAGIALPVFNKAIERSRAVNDASNMRQLGIGTAAYLNDNEDQIFSKSAGGAGTSAAWPVKLQQKYVPNWKVFQSPFDKRVSGSDTAAGTDMPVSYGINTNILTQSSGAGGGGGKAEFDGNVSKFVAPSQLVYMAPAVEAGQQAVQFPAANRANTNVEVTTPAAATKKQDYRGTHVGRSQINVLFADTHVDSMPYGPSGNKAAYSNTTEDSGLKRWKPLGQ